MTKETLLTILIALKADRLRLDLMIVSDKLKNIARVRIENALMETEQELKNL